VSSLVWGHPKVGSRADCRGGQARCAQARESPHRSSVWESIPRGPTPSRRRHNRRPGRGPTDGRRRQQLPPPAHRSAPRAADVTPSATPKCAASWVADASWPRTRPGGLSAPVQNWPP